MLSVLFKNSIQTAMKNLDSNVDSFINAIAKELNVSQDDLKNAFVNNLHLFSEVSPKDIEKEKKKLENDEKKKQKDEEKQQKLKQKEIEKEAKKKQKEEEKAEKARLKEEKKLEKSSKANSKSNSSSNTPAKDEELVLEEEIPQFNINDEFWVLKNVTINGNKYKYNANTEFLLTIEDDVPYLKGMLVQKSHFIAFEDLTDNVLQLATNCGIQI